MEEEKKQELFPYFAYLYSIQLAPEKYGNISSIEEWTSLIQENEEDMQKITEAAYELSDEEWETINTKYMETQQKTEAEKVQFAQKGAKLKALKEAPKEKVDTLKLGGKPKKKKKCACGCEKILSKAAGGKLTEVCACKCGGKMKKKAKKAQNGAEITKVTTVIGDSVALKKKADSLKLSTSSVESELDKRIAAKKLAPKLVPKKK